MISSRSDYGDAPPRFRTVVVFHVDSIEEATSFYAAAFGFEVVDVQSGAAAAVRNGSWLHFRAANDVQRLALSDVEAPPRALPQGIEVELAIEADAFEETIARALSAGAFLVKRAEQVAVGDSSAFLRDPDGFLVRLRPADGLLTGEGTE